MDAAAGFGGEVSEDAASDELAAVDDGYISDLQGVGLADDQVAGELSPLFTHKLIIPAWEKGLGGISPRAWRSPRGPLAWMIMRMTREATGQPTNPGPEKEVSPGGRRGGRGAGRRVRPSYRGRLGL